MPGPGRSGLDGDAICDTINHGGPSQAIYAFAREDLDWWQDRLDRTLPDGMFGENFTTVGLDITAARLGERWKVGGNVVLEVAGPRIPCSTFALWMATRGWLNAFTARAHPGAYLRVVSPGEVRAGDTIEVVRHRAHNVDVGLTFRAFTTERALLPRVLEAGGDLDPELRALAVAGKGFELDEKPAYPRPQRRGRGPSELGSLHLPER